MLQIYLEIGINRLPKNLANSCGTVHLEVVCVYNISILRMMYND